MQTNNYKKGSIILRANKKEKQLRFLNKGIVREYYASSEKEININFYTKPQFISDLLPFINNLETKKYQECLSDSEILSIGKQSFFNLLEKHNCAKLLIEKSFQNLLKHKNILEFNKITKTPDELYQELFTYKPEWIKKVPQYHIASYLNITPETLSRIKKRTS
ncbi:Crp/Fnr family transcriptional regulator [Tenacibaculum pacificus]|uniref:Crp/Fnr family transcriptional regulator n=1 Tax=Tenacibaculum pacificus TaxID=3018314 RepID=UPI0038CD48A1